MVRQTLKLKGSGSPKTSPTLSIGGLMTTTSVSPSHPVQDSHVVPGGGGATEEMPSCHKPGTVNLSKGTSPPHLSSCSEKEAGGRGSAESAACQHQGSGIDVWSPLLANSIFRK